MTCVHHCVCCRDKGRLTAFLVVAAVLGLFAFLAKPPRDRHSDPRKAQLVQHAPAPRPAAQRTATAPAAASPPPVPVSDTALRAPAASSADHDKCCAPVVASSAMVSRGTPCTGKCETVQKFIVSQRKTSSWNRYYVAVRAY